MAKKMIMSRISHNPNILVLGNGSNDIYTEALLWEIEKASTSILTEDIMYKGCMTKLRKESVIEGSGLDGLACIAEYRTWWENAQKAFPSDTR